MAQDALNTLAIGDGAYTVPEAARILSIYSSDRNTTNAPTLRQVRSWLHAGKTFGLRHTDYAVDVLTFADLISLEVIHRLHMHLSIQRIRRLEEEVVEHFPELDTPFASQIFFTDGEEVWMKYGNEVIEVQGRRKGHLVIKEARNQSGPGGGLGWMPGAGGEELTEHAE